MASISERLQRSMVAAMDAWNGQEKFEQADFSQGVLSGLSEEDAERLARYKLLWRYYRGNHKPHLKKRQIGGSQGPDDNVTVNLSRRVVNKGAAFLFGEPLTWEVDGVDRDVKKLALDAMWKNAEWKMTLLNELAINGGVTGDFYLQVVPPNSISALPRIVNLNPSIVIPHCSADDIDEVLEYELRWRSSGNIKRTRYVWGDSGMYWDIITELKDGNLWRKDPMSPPETWDHYWSPIIHGKNLPNPNCYFGTSDLEDADLNDAINGAVSNLNRIIRIFAHPIVWGKMFNKSDLDVSKIAMSDNKDAALGALELARDVTGAQEFAKFLSSEFSEVTQVPENDSDRMRIGAQSGFAIRVLFHELVQKTNVKRAAYGGAIVEASMRLLDLAGHGESNTIKLHWKSPLPIDQREQVSSDEFDLKYGLASKETLSARRGYDWAQEAQKMSTGLAQATQTNQSGSQGEPQPQNSINSNGLDYKVGTT